MEFDPRNTVVKRCVQGMDAEEKGKAQEASQLFLQAWSEAATDFEKFIAAYYVARQQKTGTDKLKWLETALQFALKTNDVSVQSAFPSLYENIAKCHAELNDPVNEKKNYDLANSFRLPAYDHGPFYHGTKANLQIGDLLTPGGQSNYKPELVMNHIYFTALKNGAGLAAALAKGHGNERVYIVEPTGNFENDPNVTDKKFPGNPTRSYRTSSPLKITGEVTDWIRQTEEDITKWRQRLENNKGDIIN